MDHLEKRRQLEADHQQALREIEARQREMESRHKTDWALARLDERLADHARL